jgi:hypothetical protein
MLRPYRKGMHWRRHGSPDGYYWESPGMGWSSRLCTDEDSNDCGSMGIGSGRHPRRFEQRHERKEVWGNGRGPVQSMLPTP